MEGSEDDAGTATNASRREVAREKDVGVAEDIKATSSSQQEPFEARPSCQTPAMSEDNFDGDSVPSPSAQDVNTSTEAILDMIDEFVDGPGAPKRLPLMEADDPPPEEFAVARDNSENVQDLPKSDDNISPISRVASLEACAPSDDPQLPGVANTPAEISTVDEVSKPNVNSVNDLSQASSSISESVNTTVPMQSVSSEERSAEVSAECPPQNNASSSREYTVQKVSDSSDCELQDRTVKCVSTSAHRDNVTVESAESTSSDSSSAEKPTLIEPQVRSPLRRRLVRPMVCDRRPDSTVSSTVDSQTANIVTSEQSSFDSIAKDVSSSSDAVPKTHGNVKPEEIRNISEISICKAETSMSPPKKIKLIRQKVTPVNSNRDAPNNQKSIASERDQCQSTSSDNHTVASSVVSSESLGADRLPQPLENVPKTNECPKENQIEPVLSSQQERTGEPTQPSIDDQSKSVNTLGSNNEGESLHILAIKPITDSVSQPDSERTMQKNEIEKSRLTVQNSSEEQRNNEEDLKLEECPQGNNDSVEHKTTKESEDNQKKVMPLKLNLATSSISPSTNCVTESKDLQDEQKKVPPIKLNLNLLETKVDSEQSSVSISNATHQESGTKQVPKLTIKLKQSDEMKSPVPKLTIKITEQQETKSDKPLDEQKPTVPKFTIKPIKPPPEQDQCDTDSKKPTDEVKSTVPKVTIKPLKPPTGQEDSSIETSLPSMPSDEKTSPVPKLIIKPIKPPNEHNESSTDIVKQPDELKSSVPKLIIKPVKPTEHDESSSGAVQSPDKPQSPVPKVTKKPSRQPTEGVESSTEPVKQPDEMKSPIPKVTIKQIRPPVEKDGSYIDSTQSPTVTKLNIKPIPKPSAKKQHDLYEVETNEQIPSITKLNIKPIQKPPEKINDTHRKSSSSEISESECSENDETTSTSDHASASDQGSSEVIPKVTIKLGKPGTECEGQFYTEKNVPKQTIKGSQHDEQDEQESTLKVVISQTEDNNSEKVPKFTIKSVAKSEGQPLSPKLTIKPLKPPDTSPKDSDVSKIKISSDSYSSAAEQKESTHVPKITIKNITRSEVDSTSRTPKKSVASSDTTENIPVVTKINIKPVLKPVDYSETDESSDDKIPVVSKLNIKPVIKPKENDVDSSVEDIPKVTKINIKPIKNPEESTSVEKNCDEIKIGMDSNSIPVVTKLNIKPIIKPPTETTLEKEENLSSETGTSSDENCDHIPVVTKLNIKPIVRPENMGESHKGIASSEQSIPIVTKLNIKPLVKPTDCLSPSSPKKEVRSPDIHSSSITTVTRLNIKPIIKPDETEGHKSAEESSEKPVKKPPLLMKINMKSVNELTNNESNLHNEHSCNNVSKEITAPKSLQFSSELVSNQSEVIPTDKTMHVSPSYRQTSQKSSQLTVGIPTKQNCVSDSGHEGKHASPRSKVSNLNSPKSSKERTMELDSIKESKTSKSESLLMISPISDKKSDTVEKVEDLSNVNTKSDIMLDSNLKPAKSKISTIQNCTLLKRLLENTNDSTAIPTLPIIKHVAKNCPLITEPRTPTDGKITNHQLSLEPKDSLHDAPEDANEQCTEKINKSKATLDTSKVVNEHYNASEDIKENLTRPLEISISEKTVNQTSGQDSPRIILKINKTEQGASSKIITEDVIRPKTPQQSFVEINTQDNLNDRSSPKRQIGIGRRKQMTDSEATLSAGKRLRSSRIVAENADKSPVTKRIIGKRPPTIDLSPQHKESELSVLETKRLKLGHLLSGNNSLTITPVPNMQAQSSPFKPSVEMKQGVKTVNHSLLNNENCSKNGNSKLHNILSNLHAKQMQSVPFNNTNCSEKAESVSSDAEMNSSMGSLDVVEIIPIENSRLELQEMLINENSGFRDISVETDTSQDPLEVDSLKTTDGANDDMNIPKPVEMTPQPKKRGRPRKIPLSEPPKPVAVSLPVPALEERPQRSLRLMRDRPAILRKPRGGRGRGRGRGAARPPSSPPPPEHIIVIETIDDPPQEPKDTPGEIDPTSSRIKLPRMTEALDNMPSVCVTPLSSRRQDSTFSPETTELKVVLENTLRKVEDGSMESPEASGSGRGRGGRGRGRGRTPRGRGRGRGGGRGAMYMKETMGIYGRVCGPATTTVQLFEEETCMMDDNATPAKPSHLLDEDSQSSVKSSTNESSKMKKSKFADLFDSNKIWTAADVKEYTWPPPEKSDGEHKVMMIQEQVAMFLGVKSFKRRYPELKRRTIAAEERDFVLSKGIVTEALCDLGITAVDASDVLDIMLSDYPHKYEEYRSHQRQRQLNETVQEAAGETKTEEKITRIEMKAEKMVESKPEVPKVDPEKTRQDMAAAAIASAAEWNARNNAIRRSYCVDLQTHTVQRPRARPAVPRAAHVRPPAGFYPHALLPGQYQHWYRVYTPEQLRYFPLNTALAAPPAPPSPADSSSDSEPDWADRLSSSEDSELPSHLATKRKKLTKVKRSSQLEAGSSKDEPEGEVDLCKVCKLRLEANRRYTHERFLVCANCNCKLHPSCVELNADTIRKCREYPWQCAECKQCCACSRPADDDKMLFCDLCDRGFHIYCVGLQTVPSGRWHCVECAVCKSCGAREPGGLPPAPDAAPPPEGLPPADWHHQTKRGPGGHKVYSHSLCTPCARAYRIGRYCPLCERSFIGPKGTMQLVICKLCDRQLHQDCVKQTVSALNVLDYTCGDCRRVGITSRAAAVRLAPRTIATLFMAKRRFNKYAHRQYMQSRQRDMAAAADNSNERDPSDVSDAGGSDPLEGAGDDTVELNE